MVKNEIYWRNLSKVKLHEKLRLTIFIFHVLKAIKKFVKFKEFDGDTIREIATFLKECKMSTVNTKLCLFSAFWRVFPLKLNFASQIKTLFTFSVVTSFSTILMFPVKFVKLKIIVKSLGIKICAKNLVKSLEVKKVENLLIWKNDFADFLCWYAFWRFSRQILIQVAILPEIPYFFGSFQFILTLVLFALKFPNWWVEKISRS